MSFLGGMAGAVAGLAATRLIRWFVSRGRRHKYKCPVCGGLRTVY